MQRSAIKLMGWKKGLETKGMPQFGTQMFP